MTRFSGARWIPLSLTVALVAITMWVTPAVAMPNPALTLVGQVTCSQCWTEADRKVVPYGGEADQACAARCAAAGIPPAIAVREEGGSFRLELIDGPPPEPYDGWLELIAEFVRVESIPADNGRVRVATLELLGASPWPAPAAKNPDDLRWSDLGGVEQSVAAMRGRIVVVNFWATWCAPCIEEMPVLVGIQNDYGLLGVQVVGIAADGASDAGKVLAFARKTGLTFPLWLGATTTDMASFGVGPALPATVVLDREGHVVERAHGVVEDDALRNVLDRLVRGADPAPVASEPKDTSNRIARTSAEAALVPS